MTIEQFAAALHALCHPYGGSITSWGRTNRHNRYVGGVEGSPHIWWLGADVVWDKLPALGELQVLARSLGLMIVREGSHDHVQPWGWTNKKMLAETPEVG